MDDNQLKVYIPQCGDRLALRFYISQNKSGTVVESACCSGTGKRKESVIDRLRKKLRVHQHGQEQLDAGDETPSSAANAEVPLRRVQRGMFNRTVIKNERVIEICWSHVEGDGLKHVVKAKDGGGVRKVTVPQSSNSDDLCQLALDFFFPSQISKLGKLTDLEYMICTFSQEKMSPSVTVADVYTTSRLPLL